MKRISLFLLTILLGIGACSDKPETTTLAPTESESATTAPTKTNMRPVSPAASDAISKAPALRSTLPKESLAYLRIPYLWALLATPKGSVMDKAVGSEAYVSAANNIREGLSATLLADAPPQVKELLGLLAVHARSPIEIVLMAPSMHGVPMPDTLISTAVDFKDTAQLDAFLEGVFASSPMIKPLAPTDASGSGTLATAGVPVFYRFDAAAGRMYFLNGVGAQPGALDKLLGRLSQNTAHPMFPHEAAIDASGQGLFLWLDAQASMAFLEKAGQAEQAASLRAFGGGDLNAMAFGIGTSGGMHRAKLIIDMPRAGFRTWIPETHTNITLQAAGKLDSVVMFSLPNPSDVSFIENTAVSMMGGDTFEGYRQFKQEMREELGFGIEEIFDAIGPESIWVFDEAGDYGALRIRDKAKLNKILEGLNEKYQLEREKREINGHVYYHYVIPSFEPTLAESAPDSDETSTPKLLDQFLNAPTHFYWREEGDYLLLGAVPQVLIDRAYIRERTDVKQWLTKEQRIDPTRALILASKRSEGVPAFMYDINLQILEFLGDLAGRPIDMFALPTAREADLPKYGAFSFQLDTSASDMALEVSFENNPAEVFFTGGGGMAAVASLGIVAAIAIPAYEDYTVRAKVAEGLLAVTPLKVKVQDVYAKKKRFAGPKQSAAIIEKIDSEILEGTDYDPKTGTITLYFNLPQMGDLNTITLVPEIAGDQLSWSCSGTINNKWLPKSCRAEED